MELNKLNTVINIIKRDDYARLTKELKTKAEALAEIIRRKMLELDIDEIEIGGVTYSLRHVESNSRYSKDYLTVVKEEKHKSEYRDRYEYYNEYYSLEDINENYYYYCDSDCNIIGATNKDALRFINSANGFIQTLGEIEEEQVNEVNKALAIADEINNK